MFLFVYIKFEFYKSDVGQALEFLIATFKFILSRALENHLKKII